MPAAQAILPQELLAGVGGAAAEGVCRVPGTWQLRSWCSVNKLMDSQGNGVCFT